MLYRVYRVFRVNKVSEDLNFLFESTCQVVLFEKVPAAKKPDKPDKPDKTDPINRIKRTRGVRTLWSCRVGPLMCEKIPYPVLGLASALARNNIFVIYVTP